MSSSGIGAINSGPLIIRTYDDGSANNTYLLGSYDIPISSNRVLITSTNGLLAPSDDIVISSVTVSTINVESAYISTGTISTLFDNNAYISTSHLSSVFSINSSIIVYDPVVLTEDGAQSTLTSANLTVWGISAGDPITVNFSTTTTYTINSTISTIDFQMIGSGGISTFSNPLISNEDLPGYGTYITGSLKVKQGDSLLFTVGQLGGVGGGSGGTSLIYISTTGLGAISTLVAVAGAGGGNGYSPSLISSSSGGGGGGGGTGTIPTGGITDYIAAGSDGYDGLSTIGGVLESIVDGGRGGGIVTGGAGGAGDPTPGSDGLIGQNPLSLGTLTNGGMVLGGQGGASPAARGAWGGGGYSGGGGGGALNSGTLSTSAGGGGGTTYIATSTLNGILSNVVCLAGHFLSNNNASPLSVYGTPLNPGFSAISAYSPNDTIYTNGDIQCRVLRYEMLDPPINAIGGGSAVLWSLYPAIHPLTMDNNSITESGSIEVESGGVDVTGDSVFRNQVSVLQQLNASTIRSGSAVFTDTRTSGDGIISINGVSTSTVVPGMSIHNGDGYLSFFGNLGNTSFNPIVEENDSAIIFRSSQNNGNLTIAPWTSVSSGIRIGASGRTRVFGKLGVNIDPTFDLHVAVPSTNGISGIAANFYDVNTIIGNYAEGDFVGSTIGSIQVTSGFNTTSYGLAINPRGGEVFIGSTINNLTIKSASTTSNENISNKIYTKTISAGVLTCGSISSNTISSGLIYSNALSSNTISSGITYSALLSSNTISSGITYSGILSSNTISSGITYSGLISSNTISSGITYSNNISMASGQISGVSSINGAGGSLNIVAANTSTIGNSVITGNLQVNGDFIHPTVVPVGTITMYAAYYPPAGWLNCDGSSYPASSLTNLFNVIGYTFGGSGDNFNVPDMQGLFAVGVGSGTNINNKGGQSSITLSVDQMPSHNHNMNPYGANSIDVVTAGGTLATPVTAPGVVGTVYYDTQPRGGGLPFDNRPPYITLQYIIKT